MHDAVVEDSVVDDRRRNDADAASVLARVADDRKHDLLIALHTVDSHPHPARRELRQHAKNRVQINRGPAEYLHVLRISRHDGIESQPGDSEVALAVRCCDVDGASTAAENHIASFANLARNTEDLGEVVAGSERNDSENAAPEVELANGEVNGAIAAADDDAIVSGGGTLGGEARQINWTRAGVDVDARSTRDQIPLDLIGMPPHFHPYVARMRAMKSLRTLFIVITLTIACKPYAESRTAGADPAPAGRPAEAPIPPRSEERR